MNERIRNLELSNLDIAPSLEEFLVQLGGPAWFRLPGRDGSRCRALVTLLHGNEASGVTALHTWLQAGEVPAVDLVGFVGSVEAALAPPTFSHRMLPGVPDLNRCFREPFEGAQGRIAFELMERLRDATPEALVDLHNTSGSSPAYGVTTRLDPARCGLTSLFANHLVVTELRLGALMEAVENEFPTVTIECGRSGTAEAESVASQGLMQYVASEDVFKANSPVEILSHPMRVELGKGARVAYAAEPVADADLTLRPDVDRHNFAMIQQGELLGWLGARGLDSLDVRDAMGSDRAAEIFEVVDHRLLAAQDIQPLMVTTDPHIAHQDCLFYVVIAGKQRVPEEYVRHLG